MRSPLSRLNAAPLHLRLLAGFGLVLALGAAQSIFAYRTAADNVDADAVQHRSEELATMASDTRTSLLQMQAGYRGYLLSGDEGLLASYRDASAAFGADLARISIEDEDDLEQWQALERRVPRLFFLTQGFQQGLVVRAHLIHQKGRPVVVEHGIAGGLIAQLRQELVFQRRSWRCRR